MIPVPGFRRRARLLLCGFLLASGTLPIRAADSPGRVVEGFQFEMPDVVVAHQGGNHLLLKVRYTYRRSLKAKDYPDFTGLSRVCEEFFSGYPNQTDFWEILNLKLTGQLLAKFPAVASITVEMHVAPTARIPFPRASVVTRARR